VPDNVLDWLAAHGATTGAIVVSAALSMVGSAALMVYVIARMSPDYFVAPPSERSWRSRHPVLRIASRVAKNLAGAALVIVGIAMLVLPGQGALTILAGIFLLEFPGKRQLELRLVSKRPVHGTINWIRSRVGRPPLILP
jgi:putative transmembrane protein PGPGW